jgi:hypothetical protein
MNSGMYRVELHVTIPTRRPSGRVVWVPAPSLANVTFVELVRGPAECGPLVATLGGYAARRLLTEDATGFRIAARGVTSRFLCAVGEWHRSDVGQFVNSYVWAADWDDVPPACLARLRPAEGYGAAPEHIARYSTADDRLAA